MKPIKSVLLFSLCLTLACTKDRTPEFVEPFWEYSGKWNAYGYTDFAGYVPLEIIEIVNEGDGNYTAYKLLGDNAVRSGTHTWKGKLIAGRNKIMMHVSDGQRSYEVEMDLVIKSAHCLAIEEYMQITYVRREE